MPKIPTETEKVGVETIVTESGAESDKTSMIMEKVLRTAIIETGLVLARPPPPSPARTHGHVLARVHVLAPLNPILSPTMKRPGD